MKLTQRPRINRKNQILRDMVAETTLLKSHLVYPVFVCEGKNQKIPIKTMPGQFRWSSDTLLSEISTAYKLGVKSFALFPAIEDSKKDSKGSESLNPHGLIPKTIEAIKNKFPEAIIFADVALDPYSSDGHDGIVENGKIVNDPTVEVLVQMSLVLAKCGADYVAPSDMMDGRVGAIRKAFESEGFNETGIMAYSAKYASGFYGPFRDALDSAPKFGDKKTYQMDPRNVREAIREVKLDIAEGADIVMVKPALSYMDVIRAIRGFTHIPIAAYNVSGEYAMIKAAAAQGMLDEKRCTLEIMHSLRRAGSDLIFTYSSVEIAKLLEC